MKGAKKRARVCFSVPGEKSAAEKQEKEEKPEQEEPEDPSSNEEEESSQETPQSHGQDFAAAFESILEQPVKRDPILSQNQGFAVEIKKRKIEDAVERKYVESRAALRNQWCKKPDPHENIELERQLRKAATAGVVKLFNAITMQQRSVGNVPISVTDKKAEKFVSMSKSKFLDTLKSATTASKPATAKKAAWLGDDYDDDGAEDDGGLGAMDVVNEEDEWDQ